jgi:ring-1,2-phenylacetyl-CoA epoxidase subunit PaaC
MSDLYKYVLRLADTNLVLSHRLSENCGHGPYLEEDLAISNTALDLLGAGEQYMMYAAELSDKDVTADDLTFRRISTEYFNLQLAELPNNGFGGIMARQF